MPAWRARAFHLTRNRVFLAKATAWILGVSAVLAMSVHFLGDQSALNDPSGRTPPSSLGHQLNGEAARLEALKEPSPAQLLAWIRDVADRWRHDDSQRFDPAALRLGKLELHPLIARHTESEAQREAFIAYVRSRFLVDGDGRQSAAHTLGQIAAGPAPRHSHEMLGDVQVIQGRSEEALQSYLKEVSFADARHARGCAWEIAVEHRDAEALEGLCADARVLSEIRPVDLWIAAKITGDRRLLFRALWQMQWGRWSQGAAVPLALLAAAIWYVILIHTASRESLRWWRYLCAVFAGIASVWLLHWWQGTMNYRDDPEDGATVTHEIVGWIMEVGLPEETAKLCLFAFFLPVLLHHRSDVKAALTAGCVGLGFALDENLHYFRDVGPQVAIGRLLTANFMHVALTGIVGWHLYELFRSRFHHATEFLMAFGAVVAAHGIYDFSAGGSASQWGFDIAGMIILALSARFYLQQLHETEGTRPAAPAISRTAVFCLGTAFLGGMLMIAMVWELSSLAGITFVLKEMVGLALVGLIYVRELREV